MTATFSEVRGREVYVYVRGRLVMKRWPHTGTSVMFQVAPEQTIWNHDCTRSSDMVEKEVR